MVALRRWMKPKWMVSSVVILLLALGVACGDDAAPAPTVDVGAIAGQVQEALQQTVEQAVAAAATAGASPAEIAKLVETAVMEAVPEGTTSEEIAAMVETAVKAAVTPGVTKEEIEELVMRAVATPTPAPTAVPVARDAGFLKAPESNPRYGGILRQGGLATSTFFDLHQTSSIANVYPQTPMYDWLVQINPIKWDAIIPDLAESWTVSDDGLTYTFFIREGVQFHDGAPLTAEDVVASFTQIIFPLEGVLSPRKGLFDAVTEVVATDTMTVEFRLSAPRGFLPRAIAAGFNVIFRKQTLEDNDYDLRRIPDYPGTGPFVYESFESDVGWKLERNPNYWNPDLPYLDRIDTFHTGAGPGTGAACLANTIDFCGLIDLDSAALAEANPRIEQTNLFPTFGNGLWLNHNAELPDGRKPFADVKVRQAMNLVLDKPALDQVSLEFYPTVLAGWIPPADPLFDEYWAGAKDQPGWRSPTGEDIALAKSLMADAGYAEGIKDLDFMVREVVPWWVAWGPVVQDILKRQLNIESNIRMIASGPFFEDVERGNFDMTIPGLNASLGHIADYWANWYATGGGYNPYGYSNPEFDAIVQAATGEGDPAKFKELIFQGVEILDQDVPMVFFGSGGAIYAWWDHVKGHQTATKGPFNWEGHRKATTWLEDR